MPVLDADALTLDPDGSAFLRRVLRRGVASDSQPKASERSEQHVGVLRKRLARLRRPYAFGEN